MVGIVGSRARLRVVLHTEHRLLSVSESCHRAVIEIQMRDIDARPGQRISVQSKTMVLACDLHLACRSTGMVESAMAIGQLERAAPQGQAKNLMPQANSEQGEFSLFEKLARQGDSTGHSSGIPRPVGQEHPIRLFIQNAVQI